MAPLFDSMAQLTQNFAAASQVPYRAAMQGVTAQPTVYAIDSTGHPVSSAGRFVASIVAATTGGNNDSQQKTVSLFNTDPHTMADPVAPSVGSIAAQPSSSSSQTVYGSRTSGHAAPANPYAGLPTNYATGVSGSDRYTGKNTGSVTAAEPPPAHSGSRPSTNARAPSYPTKEFAQPAIAVQRPQQPTTTAQNRDIPPRTAYTPVEQRSVETNPPTAHSNLQRPGDDLMQKLLLSYGPRGQVQAVGAGRTPPTSFTNSSPVQSAQALATVGRSQNQNYVDPSRGQRAGTSAYQNYSIGSPIQYAPSGYAQPPDDVMEELSYDDVSSPEGMGLQDAAASLAGAYMQASSSIGNKASAVVRSDGTVVHEDAARHVVQSCPAQTAQRQTSIVLGRVGAIPDPTIQAQADSTTRPKKGGGTGRTARSATGEAGTERGGKRSRSGSSRSRVKGKTEDDVASAGVQHRAPEMSVPDLGSYGNPAAYAQLLPTDFGTAAGQGYVATDAFAQYRVTSDPYQVAAAECMIATAARPDMTQHRMTAVSAPVDALNRTDTSSVQQEAQVFMTNMFGSAFVNPNELLAVEQIAFVDPNDAAAYTAQVTTVPKQDPKHRPIIEEEFGHLAEDPTVNASSTPSAAPADSARQLTPGTSGVANNLEQPKTLPEAKPVKPPQSAAFMDSFLNFLQGKKPETLTSVSTSVVTKKPVLPKYIPEPPRPKPPPPPPQPAVPAAPAVTPKPGTSTEKTKDTIVVQFSDEEDEEEPLSKHTGSNIASAVNKALLSLKVDSAATTKTTSRGAASTASAAAAGKQRGRPSKSSPAGSTTVKVTTPSKPAAKRPKMLKRGSKHVDGGVLSDDDADVVVLDSPMVTPRERSTRKAKEVASQRRRMPSVQKGMIE